MSDTQELSGRSLERRVAHKNLSSNADDPVRVTHLCERFGDGSGGTKAAADARASAADAKQADELEGAKAKAASAAAEANDAEEERVPVFSLQRHVEVQQEARH